MVVLPLLQLDPGESHLCRSSGTAHKRQQHSQHHQRFQPQPLQRHLAQQGHCQGPYLHTAAPGLLLRLLACSHSSSNNNHSLPLGGESCRCLWVAHPLSTPLTQVPLHRRKLLRQQHQQHQHLHQHHQQHYQQQH